MWGRQVEELDQGRTLHTRIVQHGRPLSFSAAIELLHINQAFRTFLVSVLTDCPFKGYFWEAPPVSRDTLDRPFEFVQLDGPVLCSLTPDPSSFDNQFRSVAEADVVSFANLSADAWLVVPCPIVEAAAYPHLASFLRLAPEHQIDALWSRLGVDFAQQLALHSNRLWLSTAGTGVPWLHIRLDSRPKYYQFNAYREDSRI